MQVRPYRYSLSVRAVCVYERYPNADRAINCCLNDFQIPRRDTRPRVSAENACIF